MVFALSPIQISKINKLTKLERTIQIKGVIELISLVDLIMEQVEKCCKMTRRWKFT